MRLLKRMISCLVLGVLFFSLCACGQEKENKSEVYSALYGETIAGLQDDELFAVIEIGAPSPVLLVTNGTYDDGNGNQVTIFCDVYYNVGDGAEKIGTIESFGTAYPIAYDKTGIYAVSGHSLQRYAIGGNGELKLAEAVWEQFDENGNASYTVEKGGKTEEGAEAVFLSAFEAYAEAAVVNFAYGAS